LIADAHASFAGEASVTTNQRDRVFVEPLGIRAVVE